MISVSAVSFDLLGHLIIDEMSTDYPERVSRRAARAKTLDGGVAISDRGYSDGDRTLTYSYRPLSKTHDDRAERLVRLHPTVNVATPDGVFLAVPQSFGRSASQNTFTLLIIRKLSED